MIKHIQVNQTDLYYDDKWDNSNLNEYYQYILNNLKSFFQNNKIPYSVNFGCDEIEKEINLHFQYEHTVIKNHSGTYYCSIHNFNKLITCDSVFEYSNANITHIKEYPKFKPYLSVSNYYPPLIYDEVSNNNDRVNNCLTIHNLTERRSKVHQKVNMNYYHHECENDMFGKETMKTIMDKFKILVNIHQTDFHHTLEELRVLPALMTGILIVSEDVPYKDVIPYYKHIIWSSYDDLPRTINDVLDNYEVYRDKYLTGVNETIINMRTESSNLLTSIFKDYIK